MTRLIVTGVFLIAYAFTTQASAKNRLSQEIMSAAIRGNVPKLKALVKEGWDVNGAFFGKLESWGTHLHFAANHLKSKKATRALVEAGWDINYSPSGGKTALNAAIERADYGSVKRLIELGADVNIISEDGADTSLDYAMFLMKSIEEYDLGESSRVAAGEVTRSELEREKKKTLDKLEKIIKALEEAGGESVY